MCFRPEILGIKAVPAKFKRDQMIFLVVSELGVCVSILEDALLLQRLGVRQRRPKLPRAATMADAVALRSAYNTRGAGGIGKACDAVAMRDGAGIDRWVHRGDRRTTGAASDQEQRGSEDGPEELLHGAESVAFLQRRGNRMS